MGAVLSAKAAIIKECTPGERRVAATPDSVKKLVGLGVQVVVETGAGAEVLLSDAAYQEAGAAIAPSAAEALKDADLVLKVQRPSPEELSHMKSGAVLVGILSPHDCPDDIKAYAEKGVDAFAMELMPRISRAQSMDVLSSQSNLAGYKAVIDAAALFHKALPMMMTAAGTVAPARVMVLGAGVAGLQAIATAKRLGAIVCATDVRPATKEQVESLGAEFVMVEGAEDAETSGGYAKEMSEDFKRRQAEKIAEVMKKQDIVITTALIPGKPAPVLISEEMVASMKPGSIIVDLAVERGGNCPLSKPGEVITTANHVTLMGHLNVPSRLPVDASALYARNLLNFLTPMIDKETGALVMNFDDETVSGTALTRGGKIVHPQFGGGA